ncbi:N-acetylmuramoyl-L-alanine amidase [Daejeonella oryzae]|uniref:N-acetylmuramoyl-L-alanine amidase n=1 Tax=Daejeonella oryzae TaxID=1122943 RepID=UPI0004050AE8|nr:N-acetylmuramoyl-L-alanine amidase [Daejeonella oryzae]
MKILNHLLYKDNGNQVNYKATPNKGGKYLPKYLIMHYTAATTEQSAISWLTSPVAQASAHLVIGREGTVTQLAPFNIITWHAGKSTWGGLIGMNKYSIGIEMVNAGRLSKIGENFICPVDKKEINKDDVIVATHKNEKHESIWQEYTPIQLEVSQEIASLLVKAYHLLDILGHDDISPIRKSDPGPAFPMKSFRARAMGRKNEDLDSYITTTILNIRSGPGTFYEMLAKPLPEGTRVTSLKTEGNWSFVDVEDIVDGQMDLEGWVFTKYLGKA